MTSVACAIYTRKSSEEGLDQSFNSLHAQREACEAFILSQKAQGWRTIATEYDDGGFSGGNVHRPALTRLLADVAARRVQVIVVYKVDRLTRSLADFAKLVDLFDAHGVSFVSVTQQFNTTSSMGRLTLNVLLSFAQFEREVIGERIRDKIAASKRRGLWMGGVVPIGYLPHGRTLLIEELQAAQIREIYRLYLDLGSVRRVKEDLDRLGWKTPTRTTRRSEAAGDRPFSRGHLYRILSNPLYAGKISHRGQIFPGEHPHIIDSATWQTVQDRLAANVQGQRTRSTAAAPSLLAGLVFDEQGNRLTPSHAKKGSRRYRYYVAGATSSGNDQNGPRMRVPAQELEEAVAEGLASHLADEAWVVALLGTRNAESTRRALGEAKRLAAQIRAVESSLQPRTEALHQAVQRVVVGTEQLQVFVRVHAIEETAAEHVKGEPPIITLPVRLARCGLSVRLIVKASAGGATRPLDPKLVASVRRACAWFDRLASGKSDSIEAIAREEGLTGSHVTRVIYAAFLAPDIVKRILSGDHPPELTTRRLWERLPLPASWGAQRELLGLDI